MTLIVKIQKDGDKVPERTMYNGSNAELKKDDGIECLNEHEKWL